MIKNLADEVPGQELHSDILIVGAGIAGLLVATRLADRGLRVIVAESGSGSGDGGDLNAVEQSGDVSASPEGRARGLGGTSVVWGGAMIPFHHREIALAGWPIHGPDLAPYLEHVERLFRLPPGDYDHGDPGDADFFSRSAKWPTFRRRNVASLLWDQLRSRSGPEIWLDATATKFGFAPDGSLQRVNLSSRGGNNVCVSARHVVIAAGAIESVRLLLLADRQNHERIFAPDGLLGKNLHDHIRYSIGPIVGTDRCALNRMAGLRFVARGMQKRRFQPGIALRRKNIPAGFANVDFDGGEAPAFSSLRNLYRQLQRGSGFSAREAAKVAGHAPWVLQAAWWRFIERRLIFPDGLEPKFFAVIEQEPVVSNRLSLSESRSDMFGCPRAALHWRVTEADAAGFRRFSEAFVKWWNGAQPPPLGRAVLDQPADLRTALAETGGSNHLGGGACIGLDRHTGVVDQNLSTFRVRNLSVISTAVFPSAAGANPTMTLMLAALRLADRLAISSMKEPARA